VRPDVLVLVVVGPVAFALVVGAGPVAADLFGRAGAVLLFPISLLLSLVVLLARLLPVLS
jgi:hypothetical protein